MPPLELFDSARAKIEKAKIRVDLGAEMQVKVSQNMSLKLLSFLIACVLWFAVLGSRNVEVTKEIPVEIITSPDLMVANDVPDKVVFRMSGPKAFLRNILNRKEEPIRVNFTHRAWLHHLSSLSGQYPGAHRCEGFVREPGFACREA